MTKIKKTFNIIYVAVSTAAIALGAVLAVLYLCGIRLYGVRSGSMGGLLPVGSVCFVSTYSKYENIQNGDVISFRADDDLRVAHRVVETTAEGFYTRGDMNEEPDPDPVTKENYVGKIVFALPHLGNALSFFGSLAGKLAIAAMILILIVSGKIYKNNTREENAGRS